MSYFYHDGITPIEIGDEVDYRGGVILLFKKYRARIVYVPGISPRNGNMEFNGLKWVGIDLPGRGFVSTPIDLEKNCLVHKSIKFIQRGKLDVTPEIPAEFDN